MGESTEFVRLVFGVSVEEIEPCFDGNAADRCLHHLIDVLFHDPISSQPSEITAAIGFCFVRNLIALLRIRPHTLCQSYPPFGGGVSLVLPIIITLLCRKLREFDKGAVGHRGSGKNI